MLPEQATEVLSTKLLASANRDIKRSDVSKWIVALGADDEAVVNAAIRKLTEWGPAAHEHLTEALESERI